MQYKISTFKNSDKTYLIYELRRWTPRSRVGTLVSTKAVHRTAALSQFRCARQSLKRESARMQVR